METKRLILAIALSIVVISLYQFFFVPKAPALPEAGQTAVVGQTETDVSAAADAEEGKGSGRDISSLFVKKNQKKAASEEAAALDIPETPLADTQEREIVVENSLFKATLVNRGAGLKSLVLKNYNDDQKEALDLVSRKAEKYGIYPFFLSPFEGSDIALAANKALFVVNQEKLSTGDTRIVLRFSDKVLNVFVEKVFTIHENSYVIDTEIKVVKDNQPVDAAVIFGPDLENNKDLNRTMQSGLKIGAFNGSSITSRDFLKTKTVPSSQPGLETASGILGNSYVWSAYESSYFAAIFRTEPGNSQTSYYVVKEKVTEKGKKREDLYSYVIVTNPSRIYLGPKDEEILAGISELYPRISKVIEYGWFGSIAKIMLKGINYIYAFIPNYGWAIVIFTIFLKILLFPLTYSSSVSMAKMQTLQPKMKAIKKKYRNPKEPEQRQKMNAEMMALYKTEKVNPAGGCLPMLLQLPILWGLFRLLAVSISVRHEPWMLWIKDLSLKDPYYVLPILMGITQIILQKMTPSGGDGAQKKMMYIMPVVITIFVANLPSGLTLYWFFSNLLQLGQQHIINKRIYAKKKEENKQVKAMKRKKGAHKK